jgi:hypothetical protein
MVANALDELGGTEYLVNCGRDPKTKAAFIGLLAKLMPTQVTGDPENPLHHSLTVKFVRPE